MHLSEYLDQQKQVIRECVRTLRDDGSLCWQVGNYVDDGAIIPLDPVRQYTSEPLTKPSLIRVYPGADGEFTLYDDDGQSLGYLNGSDSRETWICFKWQDAPRKLIIEPDRRMKKWPGGTKVFDVDLVGAPMKPKRVEFHGRRAEVVPKD